ncbi:MAG: glycosyltransferase [Bacteroidota bacterium]
MKKILFVFPKLTAGGAEKTAMMVGGYLIQRHQYNVTIFTTSTDNYFLEMMDPSINVIHSRVLEGKTIFHRWVNSYILFAWRLLQILGHTHYDIIISGYEYDAELPLLQVRLLRTFNKRIELYVSIIQNTLQDKKGKYYSKRNTFVLKCINVLRFIMFDHVIAVAPGLLSGVNGTVNEKISIIPNPVDSIDVHNKANMPMENSESPQFRKKYYLNVARIAPQKNQMLLLKAFNEIQSITTSNLVIIGEITDGEYYTKLKQYIIENNLDNRIFIIEPRPNHFPLLSKAKGCIISSLYEGIPLAILEAMVLNKIIISTKYDGYKHLLNESNSILVENNDVDELVSAILKVDGNKIDINSIQKSALQKSEQYNINNIGGLYYDVFQKIERT